MPHPAVHALQYMRLHMHMLALSRRTDVSSARQVHTEPSPSMLASHTTSQTAQRHQKPKNHVPVAAANRSTHADVLAQLRQHDEPLSVGGMFMLYLPTMLCTTTGAVALHRAALTAVSDVDIISSNASWQSILLCAHVPLHWIF